MQRLAVRSRTASVLVLVGTLAACATPLPRAPLPRADAPGKPPCGPRQYPFPALQDFAQGQVIVLASVGADGRVNRVDLARPAGNPFLDAGAIEGTRHCRFPAAAAGTQVPLLFTYEFWGQQEYLPIGVVTVDYAPAQRR